MIAGLPYDADVEYLESTGTQWIDTGVKFSSTDEISVSFTVTDSSFWAAVFGAGNGDGDSGVSHSVYLQNRVQVVLQCTTPIGAAFNYSSGTRYNVSCAVSNGAMSVDGVPCGTNGAPLVSCDYSAFLFARNLAGTVDRRGKYRVYSFSIAGKVDFVPVRFTNELGVLEGAMYDRVSRKLFRNAGTGAFTIGPDVATPVMGLHFMPRPKYTAKSYIRDGLIAMWDGIENAGWGVHDPNATTWVDLSGNGFDCDLTSLNGSGSVTIEPTSVLKADPISSTVHEVTYSKEKWTIESACDFLTVNSNSHSGIGVYPVAIVVCTNFIAYGQYSSETNHLRRSLRDQVVTADKGGTTHIGTLSHVQYGFSGNDGSINNHFYRNGTLINSQVGGWSGSISGNLKIAAFCGDLSNATQRIYCIRIYSRPLSSLEVAHNSAVDKERFNLP